jgi:hypothetical protein
LKGKAWKLAREALQKPLAGPQEFLRQYCNNDCSSALTFEEKDIQCLRQTVLQQRWKSWSKSSWELNGHEAIAFPDSGYEANIFSREYAIAQGLPLREGKGDFAFTDGSTESAIGRVDA